MLSLMTFLSGKMPTAQARGREDEFVLECKQPVSDTDINSWLQEFLNRAGLRDLKKGTGQDLTFNLKDGQGKWYVLIVSNDSDEPANKRIRVSFYKTN